MPIDSIDWLLNASSRFLTGPRLLRKALLPYPTEIALEHYFRKKWLPKSNTAAELAIGKISLLRAECSYPDPGLNSPAPLASITV